MDSTCFRLHQLEAITNNFSGDQKVGSGGYGDVYKAVLNGEEIAVKKLHALQGLDDEDFRNELCNFNKVNHKNIIRLIGYCHDTHERCVEYGGELILARIVERLLCFEYMQGGSLDKHIGVIIRVVAGNKGYYRGHRELSRTQFIELVVENWKGRLQPSSEYRSHDIDILRVRTCVEMALRCVDRDREKRPCIEDIVHELEELEAEIKRIMSVPLEESKVLIPQMRSNPYHLPLQHLKDITDNFCDDRKLGSGGFGVVYKGVLQNGNMVAVKKLVMSTPKSQNQFENEGDLLMTLKHPNIVRLLGYCYETELIYVPYKDKFVFAQDTQHLLCLEYMPNGSLDNYISDAYVSSGLDWHTRYKVIEGIAFGLKYLHEEATVPIIHLDLKPPNILLDENFVPKITDFGLSRLFHQNQTIHTATYTGKFGYMALEYQLRGIITPMADIFSLGVIIMEVITGHRKYPYPDDIRKSSKDFIEREVQKWRIKLQEEPGYVSLEADCQQIEKCIQIGLICVNPEPTKRPTVKKIIDMLQGLESMEWYIRNEVTPPVAHV
ncbi:unnamed protein product [Triticum turgidum subsp. durum]|uniref:Protein kinase domain-containing protein n=1 Tax=Triticum turgidum subsp. durum TaxID=4567 RepID=A0A9R1PBC5_TRITD|nr:unnamed protein product [Triticum turgidum subsp. durum]